MNALKSFNTVRLLTIEPARWGHHDGALVRVVPPLSIAAFGPRSAKWGGPPVWSPRQESNPRHLHYK
jgi:hypothetical protein